GIETNAEKLEAQPVARARVGAVHQRGYEEALAAPVRDLEHPAVRRAGADRRDLAAVFQPVGARERRAAGAGRERSQKRHKHSETDPSPPKRHHGNSSVPSSVTRNLMVTSRRPSSSTS